MRCALLSIMNYGANVNLQNGLITFNSNNSLKGSYWGNFGNLAYPENPTLSSSKTQGGYLVQVPLTFPVGNQWWKPNSTLAAGAAITISFSATPTTTISNIKFYPITSPTVQTGKFRFNIQAHLMLALHHLQQ
jgi:hypothetical protein